MKRIGVTSEIEISQVVLGGDFGERPDQESFATLDLFFSCDGRAIETAHVYVEGEAERQIGRWLSTRRCRNEVVLIGKCCHPAPNGEPRLSPEILEYELETSLQRLRVDWIDVMLLHRDSPATPIETIVPALHNAVEKGKIGAYGMSNWTLDRFNQAYAFALRNGITPPNLASLNYCLAVQSRPMWPGCRQAEQEDLQWLCSHNIPLLAWSSQARGWFAEQSVFPESTGVSEVYDTVTNRERRERAREVAHQKKATTLQVALAFVLANKLTAATIGPATPRELSESLGALTLTLSAAERAYLLGQPNHEKGE